MGKSLTEDHPAENRLDLGHLDPWIPIGSGSAVGLPDSRVPRSPQSPCVVGVAQVGADV